LTQPKINSPILVKRIITKIFYGRKVLNLTNPPSLKYTPHIPKKILEKIFGKFGYLFVNLHYE